MSRQFDWARTELDGRSGDIGVFAEYTRRRSFYTVVRSSRLGYDFDRAGVRGTRRESDIPVALTIVPRAFLSKYRSSDARIYYDRLVVLLGLGDRYELV